MAPTTPLHLQEGLGGGPDLPSRLREGPGVGAVCVTFFPFSLEPNPEGRSEDRYGRSLMLVTRDGASLGAVLVREGLAEQWGGPRRAWC